MFHTSINIDLSTREIICEKLNILLADTIVGQLTMKYLHWNLKSKNFMSTHKLFDKVYEIIVDSTDTIAERIAQLGFIAEGNIDNVNDNCKLQEKIPSLYTESEFIESAVLVVAYLANNMRSLTKEFTNLNDQNTADIMIKFSEELDKYLYFLESHVNSNEG